MQFSFPIPLFFVGRVSFYVFANFIFEFAQRVEMLCILCVVAVELPHDVPEIVFVWRSMVSVCTRRQ